MDKRFLKIQKKNSNGSTVNVEEIMNDPNQSISKGHEASGSARKHNQSYQNNRLNACGSRQKLKNKRGKGGQGNNDEQGDHLSRSNSNISHLKNSDSYFIVDKIAQLRERLKNIHHFYKLRIEQQKTKMSERNEVFMGIVQEIQKTQNEKVANLKKMIDQSQHEKKDVGLVDERMNEIKVSIDEILHQSSNLKKSNEQLQIQINRKQQLLRQKQIELSKLKEELLESRNQLQNFQRLNLKENKHNKELISIIERGQQNLHN